MEDPEKKKKKKSSTPPKKQPAKKRAPRKKAPKADIPDLPSSDTNVQPISSLLGLLKTYESPTIARRRGSIAALNNQLEEYCDSVTRILLLWILLTNTICLFASGINVAHFTRNITTRYSKQQVRSILQTHLCGYP